MDPIVFLLLLASLLSYPFVLIAQSPTISRISVVGAVYCDTCSSGTFSKQSYLLAGVEVHIECRFRATSPETSEQISFSVNRTTDRYGAYKLDVPSVDGVNCVDGSTIVSLCQASLIGSSSSSTCNVPFLKSTASEISVKSKQDSLCVYTLSALSYKPPQKNTTLCGGQRSSSSSSSSSSSLNLDSSKFYSPYLPPLPELPIPPFPSLPFPPPLPFPTSPPSLPFPFPTVPPFPPTPSPFSSPFPSLSHPPPPAFNLGDLSTTWIPRVSPSPPETPQNQNP